MYVVEHLLLAPINQETELEESEEEEEEYDEGESNDQAVFSKRQQLLLDFSMTIVLNGTTARTANPLFRKQTSGYRYLLAFFLGYDCFREIILFMAGCADIVYCR